MLVIYEAIAEAIRHHKRGARLIPIRHWFHRIPLSLRKRLITPKNRKAPSQFCTLPRYVYCHGSLTMVYIWIRDERRRLFISGTYRTYEGVARSWREGTHFIAPCEYLSIYPTLGRFPREELNLSFTRNLLRESETKFRLPSSSVRTISR